MCRTGARGATFIRIQIREVLANVPDRHSVRAPFEHVGSAILVLRARDCPQRTAGFRAMPSRLPVIAAPLRLAFLTRAVNFAHVALYRRKTYLGVLLRLA